MASILSDEVDCSKQTQVDDVSNQSNNNENVCDQNMNGNVSLTGDASVMQSASLQKKAICGNNGNSCWSSSALNKGLEDDYLYHNDSIENCAEKIPKDICIQSQTTELHLLPVQDDASPACHGCGDSSLIANNKTAHRNDLVSPSYSQLSPCPSPVYYPFCPVSTSVDCSLVAERSPVYFPPSPSLNCNNILAKPVCSQKSPSSTDSNSSPENDTYPLLNSNQEPPILPYLVYGNSHEYTPLNSPSYSSFNSVPQHDDASQRFSPMLPSRHAQIWSPHMILQEEVSISNTYVPCSVKESFIPLSNSQAICKNTSTSYPLGSSTSKEFGNASKPLGVAHSSQYQSSESLSVDSSFEFLNQKRYSFKKSDPIYRSQKPASTAGFAEACGSDDSLDIIELQRDVKVPEVITLADDSVNESDGDVAGLLKDLSHQRKKTGNQRLSYDRNIPWEKESQHPSTVSSHRKHNKRSDHQSKKRDRATNFRQTVRQSALRGTRSTRRKKISSRHSRAKESNLILDSLEAKPPPGSIGELLLQNHTKRFVEKVIVTTKSSTSSYHSNKVPVLEKPSGDSTGANTEEEEELLLLRKEALQSVVLVLDQRNSQQVTALPVETSLASGSSDSFLSLCNKTASTECSDLDASPIKLLIQDCQDPVDMEISVSDLDESNRGTENSELREVGDNINIPIEWAYMIPPPSADQKNDIHNFEHFSYGQNLCKQAMESTCLENCSQSAVGSEYPDNLTNNLMDNNYLMQSSRGAKFQDITSATFLADASPYCHPHNALSFDSLPITESNYLPPPESNNLLSTGNENLSHTGNDDFPSTGCSNLLPTGPNHLPPTGSNNLPLPNFPYDYGYSFMPSGPLLPQSDVTQTLSETNAFNQEAFMDAVTKKKSNEGNLIHIKINKTAQNKNILNQSRTRKGRKQRKKSVKRLLNGKETLSLVRDDCVSIVGNTSLQFPSSCAGGNTESESIKMTRLDLLEPTSQEKDDDETLLRNQLLQSLQSRNIDPKDGLTYEQISHQSTDVQKPLSSTWGATTDSNKMSSNIPVHRLGHILVDGSIKDGSSSKNAAVDASVGKVPVLTFRYPKPIIINLNDDSDSDSAQNSSPGPISSNEDSSVLQNTIDSFLKGIREEVNCGSGNASASNAVAGDGPGPLKSPEFSATPKVMQHLSRPAQMEYRRMKLRMQEIHQVKKLKLVQMQSRLETLTEQSTASDCSTDCSNADLMIERNVYASLSLSPSGDVSSEMTDEHMKEPLTLGDNSQRGRESDADDLRQMLLKNRSKLNNSITKSDHNLDNECSQNSGEDLRNFLQRNAHQTVSVAEPQIRDSSDPENNSSAEPSDVPSSFSDKVRCYLREARKKSESCENESTGHPLKIPSFDSSCSDCSDTDSDSSLSSTSSNDDRSQSNKLSTNRDSVSDATINNSFNMTKLVETPSHTSKCGSRLSNHLSPLPPSDGLSSEISSSTESDSDSSHSRDRTIQKNIHGDDLSTAPFREACVKLVEREIANTSSNEAIPVDVDGQETPLGQIFTLGVAKDSVVSESLLDTPHETAVSSEQSEMSGTPLDNLLNTLESLIHSGDVAANAMDCISEKVHVQSSKAGDVGHDTSFFQEQLLPRVRLSNENEILIEDKADNPKASGGSTSDETLISCNTELVDSSSETSLTKVEKNESTMGKTSIWDESNRFGKPTKLAGVNDEKSKAKVEILQVECLKVRKIALNSSIKVDSPHDDSSHILSSEQNVCSGNSSNIPALNTGEHSTDTPAENEKTDKDHSTEKNSAEHFSKTSAGQKSSATVLTAAVETSIKMQEDAEKKNLMSMLSKYEQLFQGRRFNLGSLKQQVRRQSSVAAQAEQECQKTLAAMERARKQLAALEAQYKVKAVQQTLSREMLVRLMTQQAADTATLSKLQRKTEHLGRQVKCVEYRIPESGVNASPKGVGDLSPQAGVASRARKCPSDSPALSPWSKRSNTWVNASYSVNNSASWQQNRAVSALHRDRSGHAHQDPTKFNKYSSNNNALSVPQKIVTPSISQSNTVLFNSPSKVSYSVLAASANVAHMQNKTNVLSPRNQLKAPIAPNVSPISKISKLHTLSESELRDRLLKKHNYSQLTKSDSNVAGAEQVSPNTHKQSTLCPYDLLGTCHDENCSLEHISCSTPSSVSSASSKSSKLAQAVPTNICHPKAIAPGASNPDACTAGSKRSLTERSEPTNKKQRVSEDDVTFAGKVCVSSTVETGGACGASKYGASARQMHVDASGVVIAAATPTDTSISQSGLTGETKQADNNIDDSSSDSEDSDSSSSDSDSDDSESELTSSDADSPPRSPLNSSPESPVSKTDSAEAPISCEKVAQTTVKSIVSQFTPDAPSLQTPNAYNLGTSMSIDDARSCPPPDTTTIDGYSVCQRRRLASICDHTDDHNFMSFDLVKETLRSSTVGLISISEKDDLPSNSCDFRKFNQEKDTINTDSCTNKNVHNCGAEHTGVASIVSEKADKQIVRTEQNQLLSLTTESVDERVCCEQLKCCTSDNSTELFDHGDKPGSSTFEDEQREGRREDDLDARYVGLVQHQCCTAENRSEQSALVDLNDNREYSNDQSVFVTLSEECIVENFKNHTAVTELPENSDLETQDARIVGAKQPEICNAEYPDNRSVGTEQPDECATENPDDQSICVGQLENCDTENSDGRSVCAEQPDRATSGY